MIGDEGSLARFLRRLLWWTLNIFDWSLICDWNICIKRNCSNWQTGIEVLSTCIVAAFSVKTIASSFFLNSKLRKLDGSLKLRSCDWREESRLANGKGSKKFYYPNFIKGPVTSIVVTECNGEDDGKDILQKVSLHCWTTVSSSSDNMGLVYSLDTERSEFRQV